MMRRLAQLAEDAMPIKEDPKAGRSRELVSDSLSHISAKLKDQEFRARYAKEIAMANLPTSASKLDRDIATANPWSGTEEKNDAVLRMLVDKHKPLKGVGKVKFVAPTLTGSSGYANDARLTQPGVQMPKGSSKLSRSDRMATAREKSLDYNLSKHMPEDTSKAASTSFEHDPTYTEMYKERFLGTPQRVPTSIRGIISLADERIEDARARGQFDNLPRGQPLLNDPNASSPYIDTTEYFMNRILKQQNVAPPWIEKQGSVNNVINSFRIMLADNWRKHALYVIDMEFCHATLEDKIECAKQYALAETQESKHKQFRDSEWENDKREFFQISMDTVNSSIRSYNLQAPSPARKTTLNLNKELSLCFKEVNIDLPNHFYISRRKIGNPSYKEELQTSKADEDKPTLHVKQDIYSENKEKEYGIKQMFSDFFRKKT
ncbi:hypothetical protein NADFUDRAFT_81438 [Nadsonia fulvescens var. elongata DSM 6958]|uniref:DnaJ homologue subfamily C member 28 conserved domain-containing protein n=1 Tax=Nadsonia fulvescens var. elongata DSM 6958 TaxID=857566 RepID=A0A1E3PT74_9ASCO|nr:hypothetical protein NADFUDRAFT_81438 [Nadsonia fulvescens var. elongata DSM 6958]